jgi:hypothetical protein
VIFGIGVLMKSYQACVSSMNITLVTVLLDLRALMNFYLNFLFFFADLGKFGI